MRLLAKFATEFLRWTTITLLLVLIYRFTKDLINPLFVDETFRETVKGLLNIALYGGVFTSIKKMQSPLILLFLSAILFGLVLLQKQVSKLVQDIVNSLIYQHD